MPHWFEPACGFDLVPPVIWQLGRKTCLSVVGRSGSFGRMDMDWLSFSSAQAVPRVGACDELHVLRPSRSRILNDPVEMPSRVGH